MPAMSGTGHSVRVCVTLNHFKKQFMRPDLKPRQKMRETRRTRVTFCGTAHRASACDEVEQLQKICCKSTSHCPVLTRTRAAKSDIIKPVATYTELRFRTLGSRLCILLRRPVQSGEQSRQALEQDGCTGKRVAERGRAVDPARELVAVGP